VPLPGITPWAFERLAENGEFAVTGDGRELIRAESPRKSEAPRLWLGLQQDWDLWHAMRG
jgi:hypothetical protein